MSDVNFMLKHVALIKIYLCILGCWVLPNIVHAQSQQQVQSQLTSKSSHFEGFAIQAAVGYQPYIINANGVRINNTNLQLPDQNTYGNSTPYFAGLSYTTAINENFTLGAQIEINPINQQYVLSILPGYALTPEFQTYMKFAWVNARITINQGSMQNDLSATVDGATAGIGIKQLWTQNWYGFIEANYVKMNTFQFNSTINRISFNGNADYKGYNFMVGVGYKF